MYVTYFNLFIILFTKITFKKNSFHSFLVLSLNPIITFPKTKTATRQNKTDLPNPSNIVKQPDLCDLDEKGTQKM